MWKDFFYFTKTERKGIIFLVILVVIVTAISFFPQLYVAPDEGEYTDNFDQQYRDFVASIREKEEKPITIRQANYARTERRAPVLAPFDPNTADSVQLTRLGLPAWMAGNILKYRDKGGRFRKEDDLRKIYGMTNEQYNTLLPYINIKPEVAAQRDTIHLLAQREAKDTLPRIIKYSPGTVIELNAADTTELQKIPGIGSYIARMITAYRTRLGGFYSVEQLREIDLDASALAQWFTVDGSAITRINLNKVSADRLRKHPYFNFYQAKAIVEYRRKRGSLNNLSELTLLEEFTESDFGRMEHYIHFD